MNKKILFITIAVVVITSLGVLLTLSSSKTQLLLQETIPTPTPATSATGKVTKQTLSPSDKETNVSIYTPVSYHFSKKISFSNQQSAQITLSPQTEGSLSWTDNQTITFTPTTELATNQLYMVTLHSPLGTVIWQFTTSTTKLPTRNDANSIQTQADSTYGKKMQQMQTTYPWLENLPLRTPDYFVAFDTSTNTFIADIYPTAGQYQNTQAAAIEDQIKKDLQKLGIDITKYTFSWTITPVSE